MLMPAFRVRFGVRRLALLATGLLLLLAACAWSHPGTADARAAKTIGNTKNTPGPACPSRPCEAVGSVTGFQVVGGGRRGLMRARENGWLVAWAIRLSKPNQQQRRFFGNFYESTRFGARPTARIAILRQIEGRQYRLMQQSPVVELGSALGTRQVYTLTQPLRIREGQVLALTMPTWAPSFAVDLRPRRNIWRASRPRGRCTSNADMQRSQPQGKVGSTRRYGCTYRTARLLYWGYYVPR
jgi:hypothetical protein